MNSPGPAVSPRGMFHVKHLLSNQLREENVSRETLVIEGYLVFSQAV
jgi:hypothetical protein